MEHYYGVIMAGGGGTRLWPLSRRGRPKQTLKLFGERSLFQIAVDRLLPLIPDERLRIVTVESQVPILREQTPELPEANFVPEPAPRGTASVVGLAATLLEHEDPGAVMAVLTADHYMEDETLFRELLAAAHDAAQHGHLVTLGIEPSEASTGYGYLRQGESLGRARGFEIYRVEAFQEKPDLETAQDYVKSGDHVWNSGMFVWRCSRILEEIEAHMPALAQALADIRDALGTAEERAVLASRWQDLQSETIDYGVMEKADDVVLLPAEGLGWWDVGSWERLYQLMAADEAENIVLAPQVALLDSRGTLIVREGEDRKERLIALLGVDDLVVVDTGDALLVTKRERAEEVRSIVRYLQENDLERYL